MKSSAAHAGIGLVPRLIALGFAHRQKDAPARRAPADSGTAGLSVVMAAHNEQQAIEGCLAQLAGLADEIVVLDAASDDRTAEVASRYTERVISTTNKPMLEINKNLAMDEARHSWILVLDPDERISPALAAQIREVLEVDDRRFAGYYMPRRNYILGRWIRTIGMYPGAQLRLVRRGEGRFSESEHHLPMKVDGPVGYLTGHLTHLSDHRVSEIVAKRTRYAEFAAQQLYARGVPFSVRRLLSEPISTFVRQYLLLGGFLDGTRGLIYTGLSAYGAFLRHARLWELHHRRPHR